MYLDRNTVKKLEQLKTETEAKIQTQRNEILKHIGIDSKFNVCIEPQHRDAVKPIAETISTLNAEVQKYAALIGALKEAAAELGYDLNSLWDRRAHFEGAITQHDAVLRQGVLQGVLTRERSEALETAIADAKSKLKKYNDATASVFEKIATLPEVKLAAPQR